MKNILWFVLLAFLISCGSTKNEQKQAPENTLNRVVYDKDLKDSILIGKTTREGLRYPLFRAWFDHQYNSYTPNDSVLQQIPAEKLKNTPITLVMATWCGDTQREVPRFFKILDLAGYNFDMLTTISVNRHKKAPGFDIKSLEIERVPTVIFFAGGKETGRIIEEPEKSLEEDMLRILQEKEQEKEH